MFIMEYENYSFPEAMKYLAGPSGQASGACKYSEEEKDSRIRMQVLEINKMAAKLFLLSASYGERLRLCST